MTLSKFAVCLSDQFLQHSPLMGQITQIVESTALLLADELNPHQALGVVETMEEMQSRNLQLINNYLQGSVYPYEVTMLTRVQSMLPSPRPDEAVLFQLECNLFLLIQTCSFDPHLLVLLAYALALADYFPEEVVREIFSVDFLAKLDAHLESMSINLVFHTVANSSISQQIHKMLGDVMGGMNCAKVGVLMPYFYTVCFELERHLEILGYHVLQIPHVEWRFPQKMHGENI
ncbi:hypothetical protein cypCar_00027190 [Cyprinus carpio]|nr:hypothetical protein cypCar_00027190 [Cyprinus carpio]